jgi:hypothetical protein
MRRKTDTIAQELAKVLTEEISLYQKYQDHLKSDQELMMKLKIDDLELSNKAKATILLKIQALEQARSSLVAKVAQEKGIAEEKIRLQDICKSLSTQDSQMILQLRSRLLATIESIRTLQDESAAFVGSSLTWIDGSLRQLRSLLSPSATYNARGRVGSPSAFAGHVVENKV